MVQSSALSHWPDLCSDEGNNNKDIMMLPNNMSLNMFDMALQEKIALSDDFNQQPMNTLKLLLNETISHHFYNFHSSVNI